MDENAEISGNTAMFGGGVCIERGNFEMRGGTLRGNTATTNGGGVYVIGQGTFQMQDGSITGNNAGDGGGVFVANQGTFQMQGGSITGNTATGKGGGVYVHYFGVDAGTLEMTSPVAYNSAHIGANTAATGNRIYVLTGGVFTDASGDVTATGTADASGSYWD